MENQKGKKTKTKTRSLEEALAQRSAGCIHQCRC